MKKYIYLVLIALVASTVAVSCVKEEPVVSPTLNTFLNKETPGLYDKSKPTYILTDGIQAFKAGSGLVFNLSEANLDTYLKSSFSEVPVVGGVVSVTLNKSGIEIKAAPFEVVAESSDKIWLWNQTAIRGLIIYK